MEKHKQGGDWQGFQHFHDHSQVVSTLLPQISKVKQPNVSNARSKISSKQSPLKRPTINFKANKTLKLQNTGLLSQTSICQEAPSKYRNLEKCQGEKKAEQKQQQIKKIQSKRLQRIPIIKRDEQCRFSSFVPKTSDNYMRLLKQVDWQMTNEKKRDIRNLHGIQFNSQFQGGNLSLAMVSEFQYDLYMRVDTNTQGHRQWFYFSMKNEKKCTVKLHIYRFKKQFSLFQRGMRPYVRSRKGGDYWKQGGQKVYYHYERSKKEYGVVKPTKTFVLTFTYLFEHPNDQVFIAAGIPYTYTFLNKQISLYKQIVDKRQSLTFQSSILCRSVCGLQLPLLVIHHSMSKLLHANSNKKIIIINARTHSGQASCSWVLDGILRELSFSQQIQQWMLKENIWLKIVPMLNPDGVVMGNYRTGIIGQDFNRFFKIGRHQFYPQIAGLKRLVTKSKKQGDLLLFLDLHGHSILKNSFIYGPTQSQCSHFKMKNFPYYLFHKSKYFRLSSCKFQKEQNRNQTARLYFQNQEKVLSFTCQNSLGLYYNQQQTFQMLAADWQDFGKAILHSMRDIFVNKDVSVNSKEVFGQSSLRSSEKQSKKEKNNQKNINTTVKGKCDRITIKIPKTPVSDQKQSKESQNLKPITPFSSTQINRQDEIVDIHRSQKEQQHSIKLDFRVRRKSQIVKNSGNIKNKLSNKNTSIIRSNSEEEESSGITFGRSLTSTQAQNLKKQIEQVGSADQERQDTYLCYELEEVPQNFSDQYFSINDQDSSSDDLPQIEKNYILQYIKQNQRQNSEQRMAINRQSSVNAKELKQPKISKFREIRFKSIQEIYSEQPQQREALKNQAKKIKLQPHKFKDSATKSLISKYNDMYTNNEFDDPTMVSITQQKKLNERTGNYRRAQKDPFILIQHKQRKISLQEPESNQ